MCGHLRVDRIKNEEIRNKVKVAPIKDKMRESRMRWSYHIKRISVNSPMRSCETINLPECRRGR